MFCYLEYVSATLLSRCFRNSNFHPKSNAVENCVFTGIGRGNLGFVRRRLVEGLEWTQKSLGDCYS